MTPTLFDHLYVSARNYKDRFPGALIWLEKITTKNGVGQRILINPNSEADNQDTNSFRLLVARDDRFERDMQKFERKMAEDLETRKQAKAGDEKRGKKRTADTQDCSNTGYTEKNPVSES